MGKKPPVKNANDLSVDFNVAARMGRIANDPARRKISGITIDDEKARLLDDGLFIVPRADGGWDVEVSLVDLRAMIPNNHPLEVFARKKKQSFGPQNPMFPYRMLFNYVSLQQGEQRPTVTFQITLDSDLNIQSYNIDRTVFQNLKQANDNDIKAALAARDKTVESWVDLGRRLHAKRTREMVRACDLIVANDNTLRVTNDPDVSVNADHPGTDMVHEIMRLTNLSAGDFFVKHGLTAPLKMAQYHVVAKRVSSDFKFDIDANRMGRNVADAIVNTSLPYAKISSPMQKFRDFLGLKILANHVDGRPENIADKKRAQNISDEFAARAANSVDETQAPQWKAVWHELRQNQDATTHHAVQLDPSTPAALLRKMCKDRAWYKPKMVERLLLINGVDVTLIGLKCDGPGSGRKTTWAVHHDPDTALNIASSRMLDVLPPIPAGFQVRRKGGPNAP